VQNFIHDSLDSISQFAATEDHGDNPKSMTLSGCRREANFPLDAQHRPQPAQSGILKPRSQTAESTVLLHDSQNEPPDMIGTIILLVTTNAEGGNADSVRQDKSAESTEGKPFPFNGVRQAGLSARVE
jgi:hypothetical protein